MKKFSTEWWLSLSPQQVGSETEKLVEAVLKEWNRQQKFAWHRLPDTKSARMNMIAAQPADYVYRCNTRAGFIEAKGLAHAYRLPKENVGQLAVLHKWALAGSDDVILVYHYLYEQWRALDPCILISGQPSWDLRNVEAFDSPAAALRSTGYFG
jgi:hypothetical protein